MSKLTPFFKKFALAALVLAIGLAALPAASASANRRSGGGGVSRGSVTSTDIDTRPGRPIVSIIAISKPFADAHPEAATQLRNAFAEAYSQYRTNPIQANQWFRDESKLTASDSVLSLAASLEPNAAPSTTSEIRMTFTELDLASLQEAADFLKNQGLITQEVIMKDHIDSSALPPKEATGTTAE